MARTIKRLFVVVLILILAGVGYYTYGFMKFANNIQSKPESTKFPALTTKKTGGVSAESLIPPKWEGKERVNVLILGGDSRGLKKNEVPRSDSMMVASIDPVTKQAVLLSILRDTYVKVPGHGDDRINTAVALGGPHLAMKTASDLLGIPIQYYVYTDFQGFMALVDAIGGIELDVEKDMKYRDSEEPEFDINLKKGLQQLNGKTALQYVRFRHDALSDFSRTERQRKFMAAVAQKMQTTSSLIRMPMILNSIDPYIETNLATGDMLKLGTLALEAKTEGMASSQIPPAELLVEKRIGGAAVISVNKDKLHKYVQDLLAGRDPFAEPAKKAGSETAKPAANANTGKK
ncbi:transcriptional attenuator, LytR family [Paenibacillus sp. UNCCL117]|uniref:LCP family protein n=1 Tax=unclassified Paenibacillus TaxID=185978 RepID=UPI000885958E|nr:MULTISPECIES: LCP family protein [unclassified Paenibacillus]SDD89563.1 cell envelope-related function transcriptional attenuator common domain-containing protein [Paenibacillus sp. cl123]SFW44139.1 transcriptional attenuator, LytR family [Paenibacillus sp. UNCCL117]